MPGEEETFNKLRRRPIKDVVYDWDNAKGPVNNSSAAMIQYIADEKYTLIEFLEAWYSTNLAPYYSDYTDTRKQKWIKERAEDYARRD